MKYYLFINFDLDNPVEYASPFKNYKEAIQWRDINHPECQVFVKCFEDEE